MGALGDMNSKTLRLIGIPRIVLGVIFAGAALTYFRYLQ
jgi:hypothetical protein